LGLSELLILSWNYFWNIRKVLACVAFLPDLLRKDGPVRVPFKASVL
jgi:hypothetical protein